MSRPGARRALRRRAPHRRGRSRPDPRTTVQRVRPHADRRRVGGAGPRGATADGRARRGQGATARRGHVGAARPGGHELDRATPGGPHPGGRPRQPARAGGAVRRDDRGGARLPARGAEHAGRGPGAGRDRAVRHRGPPPPPVTRHEAGARDGASRRVRVGGRRCDARGGDRHRGGAARRVDRVLGRCAALRGVPRGPPRRQPARAARRPRGAARLRHHRSFRRSQASGLSPSGGHGVRQRRPRTDRGDARPGRAAARRRHRRRDPRPRSRPAPDRPHQSHGGGAHRRDPEPHQGAPRVRGAHAQGAHALREGHALPRRRPGGHGAQRRRDRRDRQRRGLLPRTSRRSHRPGDGCGTRVHSRSGRGGHPGLARRRRHRRHLDLPRAPGTARAHPAPARTPPTRQGAASAIALRPALPRTAPSRCPSRWWGSAAPAWVASSRRWP